ncbi:MAG: omptin family outer membrane protease [Treponema sp.]|nr:omptin family outer membrane protease [Treponema sp.]
MKKTLVFFCMLFSFPLYAQQFSVSAGAGLFNGKVNEYVFDETCANTDNKVSELNWLINNTALFNIDAACYLFNDFFFKADFNIAVPKAAKNMIDLDWLDNSNPFERTNFSEHPCDFTNYFSIEAALGKKINIGNFFTLEPFGAFSFDYIEFNSHDGYKIYKSDNYEKIRMYGKIIDYSQLTFSFFTGCNAILYDDNFCGILSFAMSPFLSWCDCYDLHWQRNPPLYFNDEVYFSFRLKLSLELDYYFCKNNALCFFMNLDFLPRNKGQSLTAAYNDKLDRYSQEWHVSYSEGGTDRLFTTFSLNYKYIFGK